MSFLSHLTASKIRDFVFKWAWLFIAAICVFTVFTSTPHGIGITHDTLFYFSAAENLIEGNGLYTNFYGELEPLVHYPSFYPIVLAVLSLGIFELKVVALCLNALLFAINGSLVFYLVARGTDYQIGAAIIGFLAFYCSHMTIHPHLMAWTEPLFIALVLSGFLVLNRHFSLPAATNAYFYLLSGGILMALAILTRYAGFVLLPMGFLLIILHSGRKWVGKIKEVVIFTLPAILIVGSWLLRNYLVEGNPTSRTIEISAFPPDLWQQFQDTLMSWYFGNNDGMVWVALTFGITGIILLSALIHYFYMDRKPRLQGGLALFTIAYILFLFMVPIMGVWIPFNFRMLFPFYTGFVLTAVIFAFNGIRRLPYRMAFYSLLIIIGLKWSYDSSGYAGYFMKRSQERGLGFVDQNLQDRKDIKFLKGLEEKHSIFAPKPDHMYLNYLTGKTIYPLDKIPDVLSNKPQDSKAYVAYYTPCCKSVKMPELGFGVSVKKALVDRKVYKISQGSE